MHIPINDDTRRFWEAVYKYRKTHPWFASTSTMSPRPELVPEHPTEFGHFIRVSLLAPGFDIAVWGFKSEHQRNNFIAAYSAEKWTL